MSRIVYGGPMLENVLKLEQQSISLFVFSCFNRINGDRFIGSVVRTRRTLNFYLKIKMLVIIEVLNNFQALVFHK
jgi:hypothetical protein